jgi:quercetin dioxygenase-like cupin family protein
MKRALVTATLLALIASSSAPITAEEDPNGVVYKSRAELMNVLAERAKATPAPEMMAANVKSGNGFMINVVRRTKAQGAIAHEAGSEIHSLIDGGGTLVTGGTIVRPSSDPADRGKGTVNNGVSRRVAPGDVVLVPPQTPHWYQQMDGVVTYLEIRFDVGAPAGGPATYLPVAESKKILAEKAAATPAPLLFSASLGRGDKFQANVVVRTKAQGGGAHERGTEVHHILEGSGTFVTGGKIVRPASGTGPATIEGGQSRHVSAGDVVLIPANTPHWYKAIDGNEIKYLEVRFELPPS